MHTRELTLTNIDGHRHLAVSESLVTAVAYAARAGYNDTTCYRFVTALVMTGQLFDHFAWLDVLKHIKKLEKEER